VHDVYCPRGEVLDQLGVDLARGVGLHVDCALGRRAGEGDESVAVGAWDGAAVGFAVGTCVGAVDGSAAGSVVGCAFGAWAEFAAADADLQ
jgi:hypothetical protein